MISFSHVRFSYPGSQVASLADVSFSVAKGELAVLSGATGAGKSSILKLLTGELQPDSGSVSVGAFELSKLRRSKISAYRRTIGCVFGDFQLLQEKTVFENVAFALEVTSSLSKKKIAELVDSVLYRTGTLGVSNQLPSALSLGEKQRVAIARALVREPLLLIADNPTTMLDNESARGIFDLLSSEHLRGMTIFMTTTSGGRIPGFSSDVRYFRLHKGHIANAIVGHGNSPESSVVQERTQPSP